jgi:hypothetical protein
LAASPATPGLTPAGPVRPPLGQQLVGWEPYAKPPAEEAKIPAEAAPAETGPHGPIYREFRYDPEGAVEQLSRSRTGEAPAALYHPEVGDIDLVWGKDSSTAGPGERPYGLSHVIEEHPGDENKLSEIMADTRVDPERSSANRIRLKSDKYEAAVRLDFDGQQKKWLLTGYERKPGAEPSTRPSSSPESGGGTSRLPGDYDSSVAENAAAASEIPPETAHEDAQTEIAARQQKKADEIIAANRTRKADRIVQYLQRNKLDPTPFNLVKASQALVEKDVPSPDTVDMIHDRLGYTPTAADSDIEMQLYKSLLANGRGVKRVGDLLKLNRQ